MARSATDKHPPASGPTIVPPWVNAADGVSVLMLSLAIVLMVGDGVTIEIGSFDISIRSALRPAIWAALIIAARHATHLRPALPTRMAAWVRAQSWVLEMRTVAPLFIATRLPPILIGLIAIATIELGPAATFQAFDNPLVNLPARWDAGWYADIAAIGYEWNGDTSRQQSVVFFPAFPLIARAVARVLGISTLYACWTVALLAFAAAMFLFIRLARRFLDDKAAVHSAWLLATYPFAIYFSAPYSEGLFLLAMCGSCLSASEQRYGRAAGWGLLAGLTRPNGWLLSVPLTLLLLQSRRAIGNLPGRRYSLSSIAAVAAPVAGMLAYTLYLHLQFGDGFAWLRGQAAWGREFRGLHLLLWERVDYIVTFGILAYITKLPIDAMNFGAALLALGLVWPVTRRLGIVYGSLVAVLVLPPLLVGGTMSIGRMTSVLFPLFIWLAAELREEWRLAALAAFAAGQGLTATLFFTWRPLY